MNKAVPWSIKGVGFDAREAAREAALRQGMSLAEWMNSIIAERAAAAGVSVADMDGDARLEAVTDRLQGMSLADQRHEDPQTSPAAATPEPPEPEPAMRIAPSVNAPLGRSSIGEAVAEITRRQRTLDEGFALPAGLHRGTREEDVSEGEGRPGYSGGRRPKPNHMLDQHRSRNADPADDEHEPRHPHRERQRPKPEPEPDDYRNRDEALADGERQPGHPRNHRPQPSRAFGDHRSRDEGLAGGKRRPGHSRDRGPQPNHAFDDYRNRDSGPADDEHWPVHPRDRHPQPNPKFDDHRSRKRDDYKRTEREPLLEAAIKAFERRAAKAQKQTAEALDAMAQMLDAGDAQREVLEKFDKRLKGIEDGLAHRANEVPQDVYTTLDQRLTGIEAGIARQSAEDGHQPIKGALARLEARLDAMGRTGRRALSAGNPSEDQALIGRLESKLNTILAAVQAPAQTSLQTPMQASVAAISDAPAPFMRVAPSLKGPLAQVSMGEAVAEIARRQRALDQGSGSPVAASPLPVSVHVPDARSADAVAGLQKDIAGLDQKLDAMRRDFLAQIQNQASAEAPACNLDALRTEISAMSDTLGSVASHGSIAALEGAIRTLTERIEASRVEGIHDHALEPLENLVRELRHNLAEIDPRKTIRGLEREIQVIGGKIEHLGKTGLASVRLGSSQDQTEEIHDLPGGIHDRDGHPGGVAGAPIDMRSLEASVRALAATMEAAQEPQADHSAIAALERQIGDLAQRLEQSNLGSLGSLESAIRDLFADLEETRRATLETAEKAARIAARDTLQEAMASLPLAGSAPYASDELSRELANLRAMQDAADQRTHSTLNAVHETLEKVVDRLAMLEEEIAEVRPTQPPQLLAAGTAPVFARQQHSEEDPRREAIGGELRRASQSDLDATLPLGQGPDFLLEPGTGFPGRQNSSASEPISRGAGKKSSRIAPAKTSADPEIATGRSDFIAAARRAAQAAQSDSAAASTGLPSQGVGKIEERAGLIEQARTFLAGHKRPLVLSIAALFLAVGTYAVLTMNGPSSPADVSANEPQRAPSKASARLPEAPRIGAATRAAEPTSVDTSNRSQAQQPPQPEFAPPTNMPAPATTSQAIPGSDPIVVGTIAGHPATSPPLLAQPGAHARASDPRALAEAGNLAAQYEMALRYAEGRGEPRDAKEAASWFEKAAAQGSAPAQYRLGSLYEKGLGVPRDLAQARSLYERAAGKGNARAMHNLAVLCADGGGKPDYATAASWFRKAAELGIRDSQYNLAILLARGLGVQQNLIQSYMWFAVAAAQGDEDAGKKRDDVGAKLDASSLATAKALADAFHPRPLDPAANEAPALPVAPEAAPPSSAKATKPKISQL